MAFETMRWDKSMALSHTSSHPEQRSESSFLGGFPPDLSLKKDVLTPMKWSGQWLSPAKQEKCRPVPDGDTRLLWTSTVWLKLLTEYTTFFWVWKNAFEAWISVITHILPPEEWDFLSNDSHMQHKGLYWGNISWLTGKGCCGPRGNRDRRTQGSKCPYANVFVVKMLC